MDGKVEIALYCWLIPQKVLWLAWNYMVYEWFWRSDQTLQFPTSQGHSRWKSSLCPSPDGYMVPLFSSASVAPISLTISCSILPSLLNKTLGYFSSWVRHWLLTYRGWCTFFRLRTITSDFKRPELTPAVLRTALNCFSAHWRLCLEDNHIICIKGRWAM